MELNTRRVQRYNATRGSSTAHRVTRAGVSSARSGWGLGLARYGTYGKYAEEIGMEARGSILLGHQG